MAGGWLKRLGKKPRKPRKPRPLARRILRIAGIVLAVPVVLVLLVLLALHSGPGQRWVKNTVVERLGERVNGTVSIGEFDFALLGDFALRKVSIHDEAGEEVIALDSLEIVPDWGSLTGDSPTVERLSVDGVRVHLVQYEEGGSNLKKLFKPSPPKPPEDEPAKPDKPEEKRVVVSKLHLGGIDFRLDKPDGTVIALEGFGLEGTIDAVPSTKTAKVELRPIGAGFRLEKPADGLKLQVTGFETGLTVALDHGAGSVELGPTRAQLSLVQKGAPKRELGLDLELVRAKIEPGELDAAIHKLALGALMIEALEVHGRTEGKDLAGEQQVQLVALRIDADKLNKLLGKELLASDVDIDTRLSGPPEQLALQTVITTVGGVIRIDGQANIADRARPSFDLSLVGSDLRARELVRSDKVPDVTVHRLVLGVSGCGAKRDDAEVHLGLQIDDLALDQIRVDNVIVGAHFANGRLEIDPLLVEAFGDTVLARADYDVEHKNVDLLLTVEGDVGATFDRLRAAGLPVKSRLPRGAIAMRRGIVTVGVKGDIEGVLDAQVGVKELAVAGGTVRADVHAKLQRNAQAKPEEPKVTLLDADGTIELRNVNLRQVAALRGKKLEGVTGTVSGTINIEGEPEAPEVHYRLQARVQPVDSPGLQLHAPTIVATVQGKATKSDAWLDLSVEGHHAAEKDELMRAKVHAPLLITDQHKGIAPYRELDVELEVPKRSISELKTYLPAKLLVDAKTGKPRELPEGAISARVKVQGTAAQPRGSVNLEADVAALGGKTQRVKLDGDLTSRDGRVAFATKLEAWLDTTGEPAVDGTAQVELSRSPLLPGARTMTWAVDLDVAPQELNKLPLPPERLAGLGGSAGASIDLKGNQTDALGTVDVTLKDVVAKGKGPLSGTVRVELKHSDTALNADLQLAGVPVLKAEGTVARPGIGLLAAVRDKTPGKSTADKLGNPKVDLKLELPEHPLVAYAGINPVLATLPGTMQGSFDVGGDLKTPTAKGGVIYGSFETLDGSDGRVAIELDAGAERLLAGIGIGPAASGAAAPVSIEASLGRTELSSYLAAKTCHTKAEAAPPSATGLEPCPEDAKLAIDAKIQADQVDLKGLVPKVALEDTDLTVAGKLSWALDGHVVLDPKPRYKDVAGERVKLPPLAPETKLDGALELSEGVVSIPGTKRRYHDVALRLRYDPSALVLEKLSLRESDLERKNRAFDVTGRLGLSDWRPAEMDAHLTADQFLVFGGGPLGPADAPRGSLSLDAKVDGNLGQPIKTVNVTVADLELLVPDRFRRAHQPEETHLGDVIYLDETYLPPGKLPIPEIAQDDDDEEPVLDEEVAQAEPTVETGMDIKVTIPKKVHLLKFPMDLFALGEINVKRRGKERDISGKLEMVDGFLALGGRHHPLEKGELAFSNEHPGGWARLWFARQEHNATLRDISEASGGQTVKIYQEGPLTGLQTTLSGAGSPGTLFDLLSVHNAGRQRFFAQPDAPATVTVEYPQFYNLLMLSYLASNVPHMLFLDRIAVWSDAYDGRGTHGYGEIRHVEAEGYNEDGDFRVRAEARNRGAGQSGSEISFDWVWVNTPQTAFGAGVNVGDRIGGGPGIFLEWSSKD